MWRFETVQFWPIDPAGLNSQAAALPNIIEAASSLCSFKARGVYRWPWTNHQLSIAGSCRSFPPRSLSSTETPFSGSIWAYETDSTGDVCYTNYQEQLFPLFIETFTCVWVFIKFWLSHSLWDWYSLWLSADASHTQMVTSISLAHSQRLLSVPLVSSEVLRSARP